MSEEPQMGETYTTTTTSDSYMPITIDSTLGSYGNIYEPSVCLPKPCEEKEPNKQKMEVELCLCSKALWS